MDLINTINHYWAIITAVFFGFAWLIRLEAKVLNIENKMSNHADANKEMWIKFDSMQLQMTSLLQAVSRIEGHLDEKRFK